MRAPGRSRERGATAVVVALMLTVIGAFLALGMNVGHVMSVRGELQNAVDAGALAGVRELDGRYENLVSAPGLAVDFTNRHETDSRLGIGAGLGDVQLGNWDRERPKATAFTAIPADQWAARALDVNAVRVVAGREEARGNALDVWFSVFLGRDKADVGAEAVAATGGPCESKCTNAPLVIRYGCLVDGGLRCGDPYVIGVSPAPIDSAGFSDLVPMTADPGNNPSANSHDICTAFKEPPPEDCRMSAGKTYVKTTNGGQMSAGCNAGADGDEKKLCDWFKRFLPRDGQPATVMQVPVVQYPGDAGGCSGDYGGVGKVVTFAAFMVEGVWCKDDDGARTGACAPYATGQCIALRYTCDVEDDEVADSTCAFSGIVPREYRLVR